MEIEEIIWGIIPACISLFVAASSIHAYVSRRPDTRNLIATTIILLLVLFSRWLLYLMFFGGAWPSYIPYIAIVIAVGIFIFQFVSLKR
jgi:CHASE2 domain-containing sensor protein